MHGIHMRYLFVAAGALVVGLLAAGTSVQSLLPFVLLLACPLMMVFMMRSMRGHAGNDSDQGGHQGHDGRAHDHDEATTGR